MNQTPGASRVVQMLRDHGFDLKNHVGPYEICRTYAGHGQKSGGAWSWFLRDSKKVEVVGSQWTVREILASHRGAGVTIAFQGGGMDISPE